MSRSGLFLVMLCGFFNVYASEVRLKGLIIENPELPVYPGSNLPQEILFIKNQSIKQTGNDPVEFSFSCDYEGKKEESVLSIHALNNSDNLQWYTISPDKTKLAVCVGSYIYHQFGKKPSSSIYGSMQENRILIVDMFAQELEKIFWIDPQKFKHSFNLDNNGNLFCNNQKLKLEKEEKKWRKDEL